MEIVEDQLLSWPGDLYVNDVHEGVTSITRQNHAIPLHRKFQSVFPGYSFNSHEYYKVCWLWLGADIDIQIRSLEAGRKKEANGHWTEFVKERNK